MQNIIDTHNIDNRNTINFFKNLTNFNNEINNLISKKVYNKKFNFNNGWDADIPLEYFAVYDVENEPSWEFLLKQTSFLNRKFYIKIILNNNSTVFKLLKNFSVLNNTDFTIRVLKFHDNINNINGKLSMFNKKINFIEFIIPKFIGSVLKNLFGETKNKQIFKYKIILKLINKTNGTNITSIEEMTETYDLYYPNDNIKEIQSNNKPAGNPPEKELKLSIYGDQFFKFKSVKDTFSEYESKSTIKRKESNSQEKTEKNLNNPCYLKGFKNVTSNMEGTGDFQKCYELLSKIMKSKNQDTGNKKKESKSIILGAEFQEIADFIKKDNITLIEIKQTAENICSQDYKKFSSAPSFNNKFNNICLKLTYTIVLLDNIFNNYDPSGVNIILPSKAHSISDKEYSLLLDNTFSNIQYVPKNLLYSLIFLFILFILSYIFKKQLTNCLEEYFFREQIQNNVINLTLLDSTVNSLPVKNYIFTNCIQDVKVFTQKDIFISQNEFKLFVYKIFKKNKGLRDKVNETLILKNQLKASIIISLLQIFMTILLSAITTKIISYIELDNNYFLRYLLVFFSFLYMSILILECLRLINFIDTRKYLSPDTLSNFDKKFLEEEYDPNNPLEV